MKKLTSTTSMSNTIKFCISVGLPLLAGFIGSFFTTPSIPTWYASLTKPALTPPAWVFGPVWTTLFVLMGIAAFLVWKRGLNSKGVRVALGVFLVQLILNTLWSVFFFGLRSPAMALIEIVFLWLAILSTIVFFSRISKASAVLLVPYLVWVSFASYLNYSLYVLN